MREPMADSIALVERMGLPSVAEWASAAMLLETIRPLGPGPRYALGRLAEGAKLMAICTALRPSRPWIDRDIEYLFVLGIVAYIAVRGGRALPWVHSSDDSPRR